MPASSICCIMPPITTSSPSESASTSTSIASSRNLSMRTGRSCEYSTACFIYCVMVIAYDEDTITQYMKQAVEYSQDRPVLIDKFLEDAIEVDVDALSDGEDVVIGGIMQHIEEAGIHSGDSSCVLPAVDIHE